MPGGKYVMFANLDTLEDQSTGSIMRFNSDGSLDTTFSFSHDYDGVFAVASAPGGQLIVGAHKTVYGVQESRQHQSWDILRLNNDGSIDPSFGPARITDGQEPRVVSVNADGTIFVGGRFTAFNGQPYNGIVRLLSNGTLDPGFAPVTMTCPSNPFGGQGGCGLWTEPVIQTIGTTKYILIAGDFVSVKDKNNVIMSVRCVARLNSDGTLDNSFNPSGFIPAGFFAGTPRPIRGIVIQQSDNKVVIGGRFNDPPLNNRVALVRLNTDGSRDSSYAAINGSNLPPNGMIQIRNLIIQADDRVIAIDRSVWRFNTDGSLDPTFNNVDLRAEQQTDTDFVSAEAFNIAPTSDGGFLIGGSFSDINDASGPPGPEHWGAAKLHSDGSLDTSFTTSHREGSKIEPGIFTRQTDGSVRIVFNSLGWDTFHPAISHNFGRLLSDGSLDVTFDPLASLSPTGPLTPAFDALGLTGLSDGSLLVTGVHGASANYGHLLANGSEDTNYHAASYVPFDPASNVTFGEAFPQPDGQRIVVDGFYSYLSTVTQPYYDPSAQNVANGTLVQRINSDGSLDTSFKLDSSISAATQQRDINGNLVSIYLGSGVLVVTSDNKVIFGYFASDMNYHLVRLDSYGTIDPSFPAATFPVSVSFRPIAVIDPANPSVGLQQITAYVPNDIPVKQAKLVLDSKIVLLGSFSSYSGTPAHGLVRVDSQGIVDPSFSVGNGAQWTQTTPTATFNPSIDNLEVGLDDKLLLTGTFEAFNGTAAPGIISLNPDGTIDTSFVPPVKRQKLDYQPAYLARQGDGSFLLSGPYSKTTDNTSPSFFRLVLPPGVPTPTGTNVTSNEGSVGSASGVTVNFGSVSEAGSTSVSVIDPQWAGQLPSGYQVAGTNLAFEVYTTSSYTSPVTVCFTLSSLSDADFAAARLLHNNGSGLVDVTSSKDATTKTICATTPSLSPFVVAKPPYKATVQQPINADGSSSFTVKRGVAPIKFTLAAGDFPVCILPPATIAVTRTAGANTGTVNESTYLVPADTGSNFRIDSCQYVYNLNSSALGVGTYRVDIKINNQVVGSASFTLN
jgi:uncharacterized delta-60 repeat protein